MSAHADAPAAGPRTEGRLVGWLAFVAALAAIAYAGRIAAGKPEPDLLYQWSTAIAGVIQYAVMLAFAFAIAHGLGRDLPGLRRPASWWRAAGLLVCGFIAIEALGALLNVVLKAGEEQGLVPDSWDSSRAGPFAANFVVIAVVAPLVEEFIFRGVGLGLLLTRIGAAPAIALSGLAFGLSHGLFTALPVLALFGIILSVLRWKTRSVYPGMILHGLFNGLALIVVVTR